MAECPSMFDIWDLIAEFAQPKVIESSATVSEQIKVRTPFKMKKWETPLSYVSSPDFVDSSREFQWITVNFL